MDLKAIVSPPSRAREPRTAAALRRQSDPVVRAPSGPSSPVSSPEAEASYRTSPRDTTLAPAWAPVAATSPASPAASPAPTSPGASRRVAHILSEQRRRESINGGFLELKSSIPHCRGTQDSKAVILRKAVNYIAVLEGELARARHEADAARRAVPRVPYGAPYMPAAGPPAYAPPPDAYGYPQYYVPSAPPPPPPRSRQPSWNARGHV
ncbi:Myc-type, basic helix-loop-helix domain-containing protein [Dipodascopsis tothii]|uniref:Myc-type, basic helix-loop-helix domain-containing protein n=1 Tax=Dipodascopsis tothii TaxID=44089 RepID=UPI0034CE8748